MTDEQINTTLAKRMGWEHWKDVRGEVRLAKPDTVQRKYWIFCGAFITTEPYSRILGSLPDWLNSRDALAPVMEKLSEIERIILQHRLNTQWAQDRSDKTFAFWLLTLPPHDLARAIAEAIQEEITA